MILKERLKILSLWLTLALVNLIVFFQILKGYFYYDDFQLFHVYQSSSQWFNGVLGEFQQGYALRFFLDLVLWNRFQSFGWSPAPYFAISIFQNIVVGVLVFIFAKQLFYNARLAFFASLILTIAFPPIQVVTWITGSMVSLLAIVYLTTVILFVQYLTTKRTGWYIAFLLCFFISIYSYEYAVSLLPVLFLLAFGLCKEYRISYKRAALLLAPCLLLLIPYGYFQVQFLHQGTSEANVGGGFQVGLHIFTNLQNLSHLIFPDLHFPRLVTFLTDNFPTGLTILTILAPIAVVIWFGASIYVLWKGSARARILLLWVYLAFAPFTLWVNPDTAHSSRYLYLPMIAFSILLAMFFEQVAVWLGALGKPGAHADARARWWNIALLSAWLLYNLIPIQIYQAQEVAKGEVRRAIVTQIQSIRPDFPADSLIYIRVPDQNYRDLNWGIPDFYTKPISVMTVPPAVWPAQAAAHEFYFQFEDGVLTEKTTP